MNLITILVFIYCREQLFLLPHLITKQPCGGVKYDFIQKYSFSPGSKGRERGARQGVMGYLRKYSLLLNLQGGREGQGKG